MKCDRCNRPAIVHQIIISGGKHREVHLCEAHANEAGIPNPGKQPINKMLEKVGSIATPLQATSVSCPQCGATLSKIRQSALMGCPQCYDVFEQLARDMIERAQHGASHHTGRHPGEGPGDRARQHERQRLLQELDQAVRSEQYERAAELKHQLSILEHAPPSTDEHAGHEQA